MSREEECGGSGRTLVLVRHGQSAANAAGLFTGVIDAPLTALGLVEARLAGLLVQKSAIIPDVVFASEMLRARQTAEVLVECVTGIGRLLRDWRLNERNYGALTGRSKAEVLAQFGRNQFRAWRRSVDSAPPQMTDDLYVELAATSLFRHLPTAALTRGESLREVSGRVRAFYSERVVPEIESGASVMLVAHGNSLRALCGVLDDLDDGALQELNIPTGQPLVYRFDDDLVPVVAGGEYLDASTAKAAALALAHEGGT
ncbi:2,3-bisphosphoglycerate-dependent phosphoglycerate mutase [Lacisediminihabitans sp. FW035]